MRLIDADEFKETLGTDTKIREMFCRIIDEQPTAYDVEKVVGEIHKTKSVYGRIPKNEAIGIVRKGGWNEENRTYKKS